VLQPQAFSSKDAKGVPNVPADLFDDQPVPYSVNDESEMDDYFDDV